MKHGRSRLLVAVAVVVLFSQAAWAAPGDITTYVGGGVGDGGPATRARLDFPSGAALDSAGNLYIADTYSYRIRKVDPSGVITTVAGTGAAGFFGDGGPATSAWIKEPFGVAVGGAGNLYIADTGNHRIRKVDSSGVITTVAGNGAAGFFGDGGPATSANIANPSGVAVDNAGNLYIADTNNHRIRKVDPSGVITTVAGNGTAGYFSDEDGDGGPATSANLADPSGVAVDGAGNLNIADTNNHRIRKVDTSGVITTVAGNGRAGFLGDGAPATVAMLNRPRGVALDSGKLYIADTYNHRIRKVDSSGVITTVAGGCFPRGVALDGAGNLYVADTCSHRIRKVDPSGVDTTVAGTDYFGDGGYATSARLNSPLGVALDGAGNLYIADSNNNRIRKVDPSGVITTVAGGDSICCYSGDGGPATNAYLRWPTGVTVDSSGSLYIADPSDDRIRKVDPSGVITTVAGTGERGFSGDGGPATLAKLSFPNGVAVDSAGNLYIADAYNHRIRRVDTSGVITTVAGNGAAGFSGDGKPATKASLKYPRGVAVDGAGNLYIADSLNYRVRKVHTSGVITTVAGNGSIYGVFGDGEPATTSAVVYPLDVALDGAGHLYIAERDSSRIRKVGTCKVITTVAGTGESGFSGDGGPATLAKLNVPVGMAVDGAGNLYVADTGNHRIRLVTGVLEGYPALPCAPTLTASAVGGTVHLEWTTPPDTGSPIGAYRVYRGTVPWGETLLTTLGVTNSYDDADVVSETTYYYRVRAVNGVGEGYLSNRVGATPDTTPPGAPTIGSPAEGSLHPANVVFSGQAEAGASVSVYQRGVLVRSTTAGSSGIWSFTVRMTEGVKTVTATATDAAGNVSVPSSLRTFDVDALLPNAKFFTRDLSVFTPVVSPVRIEGEATDNRAVAVVQLHYFDISGGLALVANAVCDGCGTASATFHHEPTSLPPGWYRVFARVFDAAGNNAWYPGVRFLKVA